MDDEERIALVRRLVDEVMVGGRFDVLDEIWAADGVPAMVERIAPFRESFPDLRMETVTIVAEDGHVAGHFRCSGTHLGAWGGHPPTGRRFESIDELYFFEASDGRLRRMWSVEDTAERMSQLGLDETDRARPRLGG